MKDLDRILRDPHSYATPLAEEEWRAWSEQALTRWAAEKELQRATQSTRPRALLSSILFYGACLATLLFLWPLLVDGAARGGELLGTTPLWQMLADPWLVLPLAFGLSILLTPPLRQRLWQELS